MECSAMTRHPPVLACLMLVGCLTAAPIAVAAGQEIPRGYRQVAVEYGLPPALLYATALTASGRMLQGRRLQPWPWTLTLEGRRHHYPTRVAAYRALTAYLAREYKVSRGCWITSSHSLPRAMRLIPSSCVRWWPLNRPIIRVPGAARGHKGLCSSCPQLPCALAYRMF